MSGKCSDCKECRAYINETQNPEEDSKPGVTPECAVARRNRAGAGRQPTKRKLKRKNP